MKSSVCTPIGIPDWHVGQGVQSSDADLVASPDDERLVLTENIPNPQERYNYLAAIFRKPFEEWLIDAIDLKEALRALPSDDEIN
jgi:hypothetical protein